MRRMIIRLVLPFLFCMIPVMVAGVVLVAVLPSIQNFYKSHPDNQVPVMDYIILGLGTVLFVAQTIFAYFALRWTERGFNERPDHWLSHLAQAAEWFPLLGLLGTVAGILQTFSGIDDSTPPTEIISAYAPAITATGCGLFMALVNIFPTWVVMIGRDMIRALGGGPPIPPEGETPDTASKRSPSRSRATAKS